MRQRRLRKAERKAGSVATVSARALISLVADLRILRPSRDQAPPDEHELAPLGLVLPPDDRDDLRRRHVVARPQVRPLARAEVLRDGRDRDLEDEPPAHLRHASRGRAWALPKRSRMDGRSLPTPRRPAGALGSPGTAPRSPPPVRFTSFMPTASIVTVMSRSRLPRLGGEHRRPPAGATRVRDRTDRAEGGSSAGIGRP